MSGIELYLIESDQYRVAIINQAGREMKRSVGRPVDHSLLWIVCLLGLGQSAVRRKDTAAQRDSFHRVPISRVVAMFNSIYSPCRPVLISLIIDKRTLTLLIQSYPVQSQYAVDSWTAKMCDWQTPSACSLRHDSSSCSTAALYWCALQQARFTRNAVQWVNQLLNNSVYWRSI